MRLQDTMYVLQKGVYRRNGKEFRHQIEGKQNRGGSTGRTKIYEKYQAKSRSKAKQVGNYRPCSKTKSRYELGRGENYRPRVRQDDSLDTRGGEHQKGGK